MLQKEYSITLDSNNKVQKPILLVHQDLLIQMMKILVNVVNH